MTIGDVLVEDGKKREAEFKAKYGDDRVQFIKCDVTKQEDVNGKNNKLFFFQKVFF